MKRVFVFIFGMMFLFSPFRAAAQLLDGLFEEEDFESSEIEKIVDDVIASSPANVAAYQGGKQGLFGWFVGQVMKASKGKANPVVVNELLKKKLG